FTLVVSVSVVIVCLDFIVVGQTLWWSMGPPPDSGVCQVAMSGCCFSLAISSSGQSQILSYHVFLSIVADITVRLRAIKAAVNSFTTNRIGNATSEVCSTMPTTMLSMSRLKLGFRVNSGFSATTLS